MPQTRTDTWIIAGLCVAWAAVIVRTGLTVPVPEIEPAAAAAWQALSASERAALVRTYQDVLRRPDGRRVLADAMHFAELPDAEAAALAATHALLRTALRGPAADTRWLEHLAPAARAAAIHRLLSERPSPPTAALRGGGAAPREAAELDPCATP